MSIMTEAELFVYFFMTVKWVGESHPCALHVTHWNQQASADLGQNGAVFHP